MITNAEKIQAWRDANPDKTLTKERLLKILDFDSLEHANLVGANLSNSNLHLADLSHSNLEGADLSYSNLHYTNLSYASLGGANLRYANLSGSKMFLTGLVGADLRDTSLDNANLHSADLYMADLRRAYVYNAVFSYAKLYGTNLQRVDLASATMINTQMLGFVAHSFMGDTVQFIATPDGWEFRFCDILNVTLEKLKKITSAPDWAITFANAAEPPEVLPPLMSSLIATCEQYAKLHSNQVKTLGWKE